jgi:geranylgeranyl reductase family protein
MSTKYLSTTICIIGAGPDGATTSIFLAKMGIEHVIVDAAEFPRDKICGDGLDFKTIRMLNHIDPNIIPNEIATHKDFVASWGLRSISHSGQLRDFVHVPAPNKAHQCAYYISKRLNFDAFLANKIDTKFANFMPLTKVTKIVKDGEKWQLITTGKEGDITIVCNLVIGADGDHSILLRHLGERKIDRNHYAGAVRQYWQGISNLHEKNLLEIYFPKNLPMAYLWIFPLSNGEANVGLGMISKYASKRKINFRDQLKSIIETDPAIAGRFKNATPVTDIEGWGLPLASLKRNLAGNGYLLTGDAGSMISPSSGEGIGNAMITGYIAAHFIQQAIAKNDFSEASFANYNREVFRFFDDEIKAHNFFLKFSTISMWMLNNVWLKSKLFKRFYENKIKSWTRSAYEKKIVVTV